MISTTKNKHAFSRWFVCNIDQPLARFYPASGVPTACLTRKPSLWKISIYILKGKLYLHLHHILHDIIGSNIYMKDNIQAILRDGVIIITFFITSVVYMSIVKALTK